MTITYTTAPLTVSQVKVHLRVEDDQTLEDDLITAWIQAAATQVAMYTGVVLGNATVTEVYDGVCPTCIIQLAGWPVRAVTTVAITTSGGSVEPDFQQELRERPARVAPALGAVWPTPVANLLGAVVVTYTVENRPVEAAYTPLLAAMLLIIGDYYQHREDHAVREQSNHTQRAWKALCDPFRIPNF